MVLKNSYYFPHDYSARNDEKIIKLLAHKKLEGYGAYWYIIEKLYEAGGYLSLDYDSIAYDMRTHSDFIKDIIHNYGLFDIDGNMFTSPRVVETLKILDDKRKKAQESANKRWGNANALPSECEGNAIKESKVNESKVNKRSLDFSYLEANNINNLLKTFKDKASVMHHLKGLGFYEGRIVEAFEKAGVVK